MTKNKNIWIEQDKIRQILLCFSIPKTPREVEKELGIKKLKLRPFLEKGFLQCLNPDARKGRYYELTNQARRTLGLPCPKNDDSKAWDFIGWVTSSPRQRLVVLKTIAIDSAKRTSEAIRHRASNLNPCLSRVSTKQILKELAGKGLVETEMEGRYRLYWISERGKMISEGIDTL